MRFLDGLVVLDLSNTLIGTQMSQTLADYGAEVIHVEPPGGARCASSRRGRCRGAASAASCSICTTPPTGTSPSPSACRADVVIETWRPGVAERLGLGYEALAATNPRLVYASITGFGRDNPLSQIKAYEPIVMAKVGALDAFSVLTKRPGLRSSRPPTWPGPAGNKRCRGSSPRSMEREVSGLGQRVDSTMVQGLLGHDTWNWLIRLLTHRYPDSFTAAPPADTDRLVPNQPMFFRLMVGLSKDGRWMQFSQTTERLWQAYLKMTGLDAVLAEKPELHEAFGSENPDAAVEFWEKALTAVRQKTYAEWLAETDVETDVWAELYRSGTEPLHHPQIVHDGRTVTIDDPVVGPVLQPGPIVKLEAAPIVLDQSAPALDADGPALRAAAGATSAPAASRAAPSAEPAPPLAGVTVVELGTFYAAPFGATLLADLGARVIKVEQLDGDPIRNLMPFPEIAGIKVLQGKESVAVDMASEEGRAIIHELVRRADAVLQSFRAGVAERHRYTAADLMAVNPDIVYLNAPGYGTGGPCGHRPAFAPTMGAGGGLGYRNVGGPENVPLGVDLDMEDVKRYSMRLGSSVMNVGNADGFSAHGVGTALLLGLLGRRLGAGGMELTTSMLSTVAHTLSEDMIEYEGRAAIPVPDSELLGLGPLWRLYPTADGWVFLAVPGESDWLALAEATGLDVALRGDDVALTEALAQRFLTRSAAEWERELTAIDVACVEVTKGPVEEVVFFGDELGKTMGIVTDQVHPVLDTYPRLTPMNRFSRSVGVAGPAPTLGQQTDAVLRELGYDDERIAALRAAGVIGG